MKLKNEVVIGAPLAEAWRALLDVPRVARALPGASIEPDAVEGAYRGRLKVRVGPVGLEYEGIARLLDADEDDHVVSYHVEGREVRGAGGGAAATITNRLEAIDGTTRVVVETDLAVTGRAAQFGRGLMEDVAGRLLGEFAARLEALTEPDSGEAAEAPVPREELDLGTAVWPSLIHRYRWPLVGVVAALALVVVLLRPRREIVVLVERR
jgi:carbon monoxide dehydrogenase subunit G